MLDKTGSIWHSWIRSTWSGKWGTKKQTSFVVVLSFGNVRRRQSTKPLLFIRRRRMRFEREKISGAKFPSIIQDLTEGD